MNFANLKNKHNLEKIFKEKQDLEDRLIKGNMSGGQNQDMNQLSIDLNQKSKIFDLVTELYSKINAYEQTEDILNSENDSELIDIAKSEQTELLEQIADLEAHIKKENYSNLLHDPDDNKSVVVEIRAGAGGDEASLFANDIFRMYTQYANAKNWKIEIVDNTISEGGGSKEIVAQISGKDVFKSLKFESGVHRVQRIPSTESSGRIHTSTVSVAILPEAKDIDINIKPEDLRIDVMRASGAGGQSVNKTDSAVRITHIPTNIVVSCQETKYQQQNKDKAMAILKSRIYDREKSLQQNKRSSLRLSQIGSAMRAEKIRTYNYPQSRVTDHRIKKSWHNLEEILDGNIDNVLEDIKNEMINLEIEAIEKDERNKDSGDSK